MKIKYIDIDISKPVDPVFIDPRYEYVKVVILWREIPLGILSFYYPPGGILTAQQILNEAERQFGRLLWMKKISGEIDPEGRSRTENDPTISVVICTRDRALSLERCLQSLQQLDYGKHEIIIIDNCTKDSSVFDVAKNYGCRYVREDRPGLDWARNAGVKSAAFDIVAFIDDDAFASKGWLKGIAKAFSDKDVMAATGMVLPYEIETPSQLYFEEYGGMNKGFYPFNIKKENLNDCGLFFSSSWGVGANMAFRKELFEKTGYFDTALDVGTPTSGGGDIEYFFRVVYKGYKLRYEPSAMVKHLHRRNFSSLKKQIFNNGRSFPAFLLTIGRYASGKRLALFSFTIKNWLISWIFARIFRSVFNRSLRDLNLALTELFGIMTSVPSYIQSRRIDKRYY